MKYFIAIDILEKLDMPSNDDIPKKDTEIQFKNGVLFLGLVDVTKLLNDRIYGINDWAYAQELDDIIAQHLKGEIISRDIRERLRNLETRSVDGYRPEYSVGLTWINPDIALKNVDLKKIGGNLQQQ